jgi:hypothetical protein
MKALGRDTSTPDTRNGGTWPRLGRFIRTNRAPGGSLSQHTRREACRGHREDRSATALLQTEAFLRRRMGRAEHNRCPCR